MQIYAHVTGRPMKVSRSGQTCALGAAIFGSVVGGAHKTVAGAQAAMTGVKERVYTPNAASVAVYEVLYRVYKTLHDAFGGKGGRVDVSGVMKELIKIRQGVRNARVASPSPGVK